MVILFEISLIILFGIAVIHGIHRFNTKRLLLAFTIIAVITAAAENLTMLMVNAYSYSGYTLWIAVFPVCIALAWVTVSYLGFILASKYNTIIGVAAASSVDLILEPAAFFLGLWTWTNIPLNINIPLNYFNAPPINAIGWISITWIGIMILKKLLPSFWGKKWKMKEK